MMQTVPKYKRNESIMYPLSPPNYLYNFEYYLAILETEL